MAKTTTVQLSEDERKVLKKIGGGSMVEGIRKLIKETEEIEEEENTSVVLPEDPIRRKAYERLWEGSRIVNEKTRVTDMGSVFGILCPALGMTKEAVKNVMEDLISDGFVKKNQGMDRVQVMVFRLLPEED